MTVIGGLVLGFVVGCAAMRGAAMVAATAKVVDLEDAHRRDSERLAWLHRLQLEAVQRGTGQQGLENAWQAFRQARITAAQQATGGRETATGVLPLEARRRRRDGAL